MHSERGWRRRESEERSKQPVTFHIRDALVFHPVSKALGARESGLQLQQLLAASNSWNRTNGSLESPKGYRKM